MTDQIETTELMRALAKTLDGILNPPGGRKTIGFALFTFPIDGPEGARTNYASNCQRADMVIALKEVVARFEGQPHLPGRA
ncbi:hypothetical protein [Shinella zoogloeoides]|uniref:hypothetical protein n=1 Tax=Shinella zoogloeoides TaxID=352475 RepID=UPI00299F3A04|nr:hypothetical protein [Shinella zoogloeoides]WPE19935.1 hypothetical protein ShzoTeo12_11130 [Shinella zoogloeoides]